MDPQWTLGDNCTESHDYHYNCFDIHVEKSPLNWYQPKESHDDGRFDLWQDAR